MEFIVRSPLNQPDVAEVRYDCPCGCKPRARYTRNTEDAGHEHCCCGIVHFIGAEAVKRLQEYMADRATRDMDAGLKYTYHTQDVKAPWGQNITVAYGLPTPPKKHWA